MTAELATRSNGAAPDAAVMERVIATGDLDSLTPNQRVQYYEAVCASIGLNSLTQPFAYIKLNGKLTLYATRAATDQIRALRHVSLSIEDGERIEDVYRVKVRATLPDGRTDMSTGAVGLGGLKGEALANALMKAETKAKRRATLSICGLGWLDESEVGSIPNAPLVQVDTATGEIVQPAQTAIRMVNPNTAEVTVPAEELRHVEEGPVDYAARYGPDLVKMRNLPPAEMYGREDKSYLRSLKAAIVHDAQQLGVDLPADQGYGTAVAWSMNAVALLVEAADAAGG